MLNDNNIIPLQDEDNQTTEATSEAAAVAPSEVAAAAPSTQRVPAGAEAASKMLCYVMLIFCEKNVIDVTVLTMLVNEGELLTCKQ